MIRFISDATGRWTSLRRSEAVPSLIVCLKGGYRPGLDGRTPDADIIDLAGVVEGSETEMAGTECLVVSNHDGPCHIVEIDFDQAIGEGSLKPDFMPDVQAPIDALGCLFGDFGSGLVIDDKNVVGMVIGSGGDVSVIKAGGGLKPEEQAHIAVAVFLACLNEVSFENKIAENLVGDESDVDGRTDGGRVFTLADQFERGALVVLGHLPRGGIGHGKAAQCGELIEVLFVKEFVAGGKGTVGG